MHNVSHFAIFWQKLIDFAHKGRPPSMSTHFCPNQILFIKGLSLRCGLSWFLGLTLLKFVMKCVDLQISLLRLRSNKILTLSTSFWYHLFATLLFNLVFARFIIIFCLLVQTYFLALLCLQVALLLMLQLGLVLRRHALWLPTGPWLTDRPLCSSRSAVV